MRRRKIASVRRRLADGRAWLDRLDRERIRRGDFSFGQEAEDGIVWNELLELELQDVDEQVRKICEHSGESTGAQPPAF